MYHCLRYAITAACNSYRPAAPGCLWSVMSAPPWLLLQDGGGGAKMEVDNCLSELEAGDFGEDDSDCDECGKMAPNIEGCCLFYKVSRGVMCVYIHILYTIYILPSSQYMNDIRGVSVKKFLSNDYQMIKRI